MLMHEPGGRAPAPGPLRLVQLFVNTTDLEDDVDVLADTHGLAAWLAGADLLDRAADVSAAEHAHALELREAIRELAAAHAGHEHDPGAAAIVNETARRAGLRPILEGPLSLRFQPEAGGVDGALGRIVGAIHLAIADGTWPRLKACERHSCRWAFYDSSKNRSGQWCSMATCGSREKNRRAYRRRRARG